MMIFWLQLQETEDMENDIDELIQDFEHESHRQILHTVVFYWWRHSDSLWWRAY